ncbi:MAG: YbaB/EbfC family nucleoid-associated protein [Bacteroidota bacterium]
MRSDEEHDKTHREIFKNIVTRLQSNMQEAQKKVERLKVTAESGGGLVKATMNGQRKLLKMEIDPSIFKINEKEMLEDLVVAAVGLAMESIDKQSQEILDDGTSLRYV